MRSKAVKSRWLRGRMLRSALAVVVVAAVAVLVPGTPALAAVPASIPYPNSNGIASVWDPVDTNGDGTDDMGQADMVTAQIHKPGSFTPTVRVRVWFPAGYSSTGAGHRVLYLLHGGNGQFSDWSDPSGGNLAARIQNLGFDGLIVQPEGGRAGWYQDWAGNTNGGFRPGWETFHIQQLIPWIDQNFNTDASRAGRMVAGLSMGGYGALKYAVRHPDLFSTVASFSGGTTIHGETAMNTIDQSLYVLGASIQGEGYPGDVLGQTWWDHQLPATWKEERLPLVFGPTSGWNAYDPQARAAEYDDFANHLFLYAGTGEPDILTFNNDFHAKLKDPDGPTGPLGTIPHRYCRGTGGHDWTSWSTSFEHFLSTLVSSSTPTCPAGWTNVT
ncbi:alpha/beta hydrolase [Thermomonospora echinospora]|nr:alpha/beta hydrolase-fold protein [Thermomonospora echinospora]